MSPEDMHRYRVWTAHLWLRMFCDDDARLISPAFLDAAEAEMARGEALSEAASTPATTPPTQPPARRDETAT